jgi:chromosome partitioning protein
LLASLFASKGLLFAFHYVEGGSVSRVIAVSSQKGGVGKTTTAKELAAAWAESGLRVLVVDADPSFAVTRALGITPSSSAATVYDVMKGDSDVPAATSPTSAPGVDVLAGDRRMEALALALVSQFRREEVLSRALEGHADSYDIVVIDTQPGLGQLTVNALCAARDVLVPVAMTDPDALQGAAEARAAVAQLVAQGVDARVRALVKTRANPSRRIYRELASEDGGYAPLNALGVPIAETEIPLCEAPFGESAAAHVPLVCSHPDSKPACAYRRLAAELLDQPRLKAVA